MKTRRACSRCLSPSIDKGRAWDGRRAYRCRACRHEWTEGWQGMARQRPSPQRQSGHQFADSGATNQKKLRQALEQYLREMQTKH